MSFYPAGRAARSRNLSALLSSASLIALALAPMPALAQTYQWGGTGSTTTTRGGQRRRPLMEDIAEKRGGYVVGPDGSILTPSNLPQAGRIRWVAQRKAELIAAVSGGLLTMQEACLGYAISPEEFTDWERRFVRRGLYGLRISVRDADKITESAAAEPIPRVSSHGGGDLFVSYDGLISGRVESSTVNAQLS